MALTADSAPIRFRIRDTSPGVLPAWAQGHAVGEMFSVPNTKMKLIEPVPRPPGTETSAAMVDDWCGATIRHAESWFICGPAGGHGGYCGNEVNGLKLNTDVPAWERICEPTAPDPDGIYRGMYDAAGNPGSFVVGSTPEPGQPPLPASFAPNYIGGTYRDLKPAAGHCGFNPQFLQNKDEKIEFFVRSPSGIGATPPNDFPHALGTQVRGLPWATKQWRPPYHYPIGPGGYIANALYPSVACDPRDDMCYMWDPNWGRGTFRWEPVNGVFTEIAGPPPTQNYTYPFVIDTTRDLLYVFGWPQSVARRLPLAGGTWQTISYSGAAAAWDAATSIHTAAEYDPINDCFWIMTQDFRVDLYSSNARSALFKMNAATLFVEEFFPTLSSGLTKIPNRPNGWHNAMRYVPELKGITGQYSVYEDQLFMRTS